MDIERGANDGGGRVEMSNSRIVSAPNGQALSCAARAHLPKPMRRAACLHVRRAMQAA
jgi:hypothetical protein